MGEASAQSAEKTASFRARDGFKILLIAFVVALLLRTLVIEGFRIPTESMEKSLLVGDFVLVSKLHYGPRLPMTVGVPLTNWYLDETLPAIRLPGLTLIQRGDAIVFNYPIDAAPIDRRVHYIKRVIGLPGDSVSIRDKHVFVNGQRVPELPTMQQRWQVEMEPGSAFPLDSLRALGATQVTRMGRARNQIAFEGTDRVASIVRKWPHIEQVTPYVLDNDTGFGIRIFPRGSGFGRDNYGPLYIPQYGDTLTVNGDNWLVYQELIKRHEGHVQARLLPDGVPEIEGIRTTQYIVEQDYYFVMGDNRDSSVDSRVWGFVPQDHIVGKAILIYFSWDAEAGKPRFDRLLRTVR